METSSKIVHNVCILRKYVYSVCIVNNQQMPNMLNKKYINILTKNTYTQPDNERQLTPSD